MAVAPGEFPPPFDPADFVGPPTDPEDERLEAGIVIVGGGPAGLACANKVMQLLEDEPELTEQLGEIPVAVLEKGKACGAHNVSGANMRPSAMEELFPELDPEDWPVYQKVEKDAVYLLTKKRAIPLKPPPPNFRNHGNYVTSVAKLSRFLADKAEEAGAYILTETAADKLLVEDRIVRGVRSGDKGRDREGNERGNFEPGSDLIAKATVLAEGTIGHLTDAAVELLRPRRRPEALGDRRQGGLGGPEAARPRDPHDELAASARPEVQRVRRLVHLPDGRGQALHRHGRRPRHDRRDLLVPRPPPAAEDPPVHPRPPRGRQAGRLGREDDSVRRLLVDAAQARGARAWSCAATTSRCATSPTSRASTTRCTPGSTRPRRSSRA